MLFHDLLAYCQTYAVARVLGAGMQTLENYEYLLLVLARYADSIVGN